MLKALLFDLDDTLIWDEKSVAEAFQMTCKLAGKHKNIDSGVLQEKVEKNARALYASFDTYSFTEDIGISPLEMLWGHFHDEGYWFEKLESLVPGYRKQAWTKGLQDMGIEDEWFGEQLAATFMNNRRKLPFVYHDTFTVLDQLKGEFQLLMLTNGSPDLQQTKLNLTPKLAPYFDHIVVSGAFGKGKPDPSIFMYALDCLGVAREEAMMVGDNLKTDILGASRAGLDSVWVNHHRQKQQEEEPTYEIAKLEELLPIVEKSV